MSSDDDMDTKVIQIRAIVGSILFLIVAPGTVIGVIPWLISRWKVQPAPPGFFIFQFFGAVVLMASILILLEAFTRFALQGIGTPAPVLPTRHLVVTGFYRYVRNPMYVALVLAILGQSMILGNPSLVLYAAFVWLVSHVFVVVYEEPTLRKTFGDEYDVYCAHVSRWIPRLQPWERSARQRG
jgi:protein-S-isoprenylcysteine O-methyltransferase Ste14